MHFKTQYKARSPYGGWSSVGIYGTESQAISAALMKKKQGALLVRVIDKKNRVIYSS